MRDSPAPHAASTARDGHRARVGERDAPGDAEPAVAESLAPLSDDPAQNGSSDAGVIDPIGLLRIASMVKKVDDQLDHMDLDEAAAERLAGIARDVRSDLAHAVSAQLLGEFDRLVGESDARRSLAETSLVHAQLTGWLDGVMQGLQLQAAAMQAAHAQRLMESSARPSTSSGSEPGSSNRRDNS